MQDLTLFDVLGDAKFAAIVSGQVMQKDANQQEIPRLQRPAAAPPLLHFTDTPERNAAITQAHLTGCYSLKEIGKAFGLHYATVSRIIKIENEEKHLGAKDTLL